MAGEEGMVSYEECNKQGKIFALANRLGHDLEKYTERYMKSRLVKGSEDSDYAYYQIASPSYSLDLVDDEELQREAALEGGIANDEAYWIGFFYRYLILALAMNSEKVLTRVPFAMMRSFYAAWGGLPKAAAGKEILARLEEGES